MVRDALLEVLKEASNMRLEPDESIAVVVTGGAPGYPGTEGGTVLTIHVKKRDVDAFAEGDLDPEEFQERATMVLHGRRPSTARLRGGLRAVSRPSPRPRPARGRSAR